MVTNNLEFNYLLGGNMNVAVLGIGTMGAGMARNLLRAGHTVRLWNRSRDKAAALEPDGAVVTDAAAEAVAGAEIVVTMMFDLDATREVVASAAGSFGDDVVWIQTATVGVDGAAELAAFAAGQHLAMLDAPVLGTKKPAEEGTLVVLASGDPALRPRVEPVLQAIASRTIWAGDQLGAGSALKLACNAWVFSITVATAQSLALAGRLGLDPELFLDSIADSSTGSPYAQVKGRAMLAGDYTPSFELDGALKDLGFIVATAERAGLDSRVIAAVRDTFTAAQQAGYGDSDFAAVYEVMGPAARG